MKFARPRQSLPKAVKSGSKPPRTLRRDSAKFGHHAAIYDSRRAAMRWTAAGLGSVTVRSS